MSGLLNVKFYTKNNCLLCEEALTILKALQMEYNFRIKAIDIYEDDALLEKYQVIIPVVEVKETVLTANEMSWEHLENTIRKALPFI